jgi:hypothetical protein
VEGLLEQIPIELSQYYSEGWKYGPPRGIFFHSGTRLCDVGTSVHFSITQDGIATQHVPLNHRSWHAQEASDYYFSIFHFVDDSSHPVYSHEQLKESARISAEIIRFTKDKLGMLIPVVRAPGQSFSPGFKEHRDGLGAGWNKSFHQDGLVSTWTWQEYLYQIKMELEEDDMALFENKEDFRNETLKALVGSDGNGNPRLDTERMYESLLFLSGANLRMKGGERPSRADAAQKGWDFANHVMGIDPEALGLEFPNGKLQGTITFS